jgi:hypothetical protein
MKKETKLKIGDVVEATCVITDKKHDGEKYIHAVKGTLGIVLSDDFDATFPCIKWCGPGGAGTCNVTKREYRKFKGRVQCAIDE